MLPEYFAIIGAIIASLGGLYYLYQTIIGKTKPNRVTWLLWWIFPMIAFVAQRIQGVEDLSWVTFVSGFTPFLVLLASFFNKKAYWKTESKDYVLMIIAFLGIGLSFIVKNPNLAILFTVVADLFAGLPTLIKAIKRPETESWIAYGISTIGFTISILAIHTFDFQNAAFVIYLALMNGLLAVVSSRKPRRILKL